MKAINIFTYLLIAVIGVSCVSQKKYQSAVAELEKLKTTSAVESAVANTDKPLNETQSKEEVRQLELQMQEMGMEIERLQARIEKEKIPELSPEQQMQLQDEQSREFELKMMEMQDKIAKDESRSTVNESNGLLTRVEAAAHAAFKVEAASDVTISRTASSVTISISNDALFGTGQELSSNGNMLVDKLVPVISQRGPLSISTLSVGKTSNSADFKKAYTVHERLLGETAYSNADPVAGIVGCEYAKVTMKDCNRIDIIFYTLNEPLVQMLSN